MSAPAEMLAAAQDVMQNAYAPYSKLHVGVCIRAEDQQLFSGCNVENASYSLTLCAESVAIGQLISAGCKAINEVLIVTDANVVCPPCGACRQRLQQIATPDAKVHLCTTDGTYQSFTLTELLPYPFTL